MKQVHLLRHAPKHATGALTDAGKKLAQERKKQMDHYDLIIASDKPRAVETAVLLTGKTPLIDKRAGTPAFTPEQMRQLHLAGEKHPFGVAGVIFDHPQYRPMIITQAKQLTRLIEELMNKLPADGKALIISHDGVMVATEKLLKKLPLDRADKTYPPLHGFSIDAEGKVINL
ncbi:phosphoglycerate mutase family protein [Patescibacteria group bacterium]|nr:phosphoglycerate mutase family protein [Patescibacteria group bacterium]MCL5091338.1 phosphoglycerate mutase family protein [Patescibacteria group bacterium]